MPPSQIKMSSQHICWNLQVFKHGNRSSTKYTQIPIILLCTLWQKFFISVSIWTYNKEFKILIKYGYFAQAVWLCWLATDCLFFERGQEGDTGTKLSWKVYWSESSQNFDFHFCCNHHCQLPLKKKNRYPHF